MERRQHVRIPVHGSAVLSDAGRQIHARLCSVSPVALEVTCQLGTPRFVDEHAVELDVCLDSDGAAWSHTTARVVRVRAARNRLVLAYDLTPDLAARFEPIFRAAQLPSLRVVVVDRVDGRRARVADVFREHGCFVVEAISPLEVFDWLASGLGPAIIAVGDTVPADVGEDLRRYLELAQPGVRIVEICDHDSDVSLSGFEDLAALEAHITAMLQDLEPRDRTVTPVARPSMKA